MGRLQKIGKFIGLDRLFRFRRKAVGQDLTSGKNDLFKIALVTNAADHSGLGGDVCSLATKTEQF